MISVYRDMLDVVVDRCIGAVGQPDLLDHGRNEVVSVDVLVSVVLVDVFVHRCHRSETALEVQFDRLGHMLHAHKALNGLKIVFDPVVYLTKQHGVEIDSLLQLPRIGLIPNKEPDEPNAPRDQSNEYR
nr:hypothetical protein [Arsenicitalea aurantiaca]